MKLTLHKFTKSCGLNNLTEFLIQSIILLTITIFKIILFIVNYEFSSVYLLWLKFLSSFFYKFYKKNMTVGKIGYALLLC
jgi:hypothetical protein